MKNFQLFRYLKKWMPLIVIFFAVMTVFSYQVLNARQKYTASAVIEYQKMGQEEESEPTEDGTAPDGTSIDVTEIYSSANMAKAMANLGLSYNSYSLDAFCASIKVEPVLTETADDAKENEKEEEKPQEQPSAYIVSCTLDSEYPRGLARDLLNELLNVYFSDYSSKHINVEQVNHQTKDLVDSDYDYLEMVERIDAEVTETLYALDARYRRAEDFRSVDTGYSFWDLCDQFSLIQKIDVSRLYSLVLGNQLTKDKNLLINKYQNRIAENNLTGEKAQADIADALKVIESYVEKMRQSGNTDIDHNYILDDIYDDHWESGNLVDRTGEYDKLLTSWIDYRDRWDYSVINAAYCQYVIGVYRDGNTGLNDTQTLLGPDFAPAAEEKPISIVPPATVKMTNEEIQEEIRSVLDKMNRLYDTVAQTNVEYNEYLGAQSIRILSSASLVSSINLKFYMAIIAVFFLLVGCGGAVLLGRAGDILEYLFLRDRTTGCMNRPSCDSYIEKWKDKPLSSKMCCCNIQITNQREMNEQYGRDQVDLALKEFGRVLRELFEDRNNGFVGYNGSGQFWAFFEKESSETIAEIQEHAVLVLAQTLSSYSFVYQLGAVNAGELEQFYLRNLISQAVKERKPYKTQEFSDKEARP